jgi:Rps23 Pro-64 3,4-dihydroxylase Tpa1-like proline 4-hydroxylase
MTRNKLLKLRSLEVFTHPFPYFTAVDGFGDHTSGAILDWLEIEAPWALVETDFYEQHEFSLADVSLPPHIAFLSDASFLNDLRSEVERIFAFPLRETVDCTVHKLVPGQRIRIHNDFIPGGATHRVLVQLNRGWHDDQGGFLMFFNSGDPADVHRVLSPVHDSVVGFAISEQSHHAVSLIHEGERFTLVYSFYGKNDE